MVKSGMNLQDSFLNQVRKDNTEIMLVLLDGTRLNGYVRGFDNFTVIMSARGSQHLIYKHAIAQIVSRRPPHIEGERESHEAHENASLPEMGEAAGPAETESAEPQAQPHEGPRREESHALRPEGQRPEGQRREEPRRPREENRRPREDNRRPREDSRRRDEAPHRDKFNTIDFSNIKVSEEGKD